MKQTDLELEMKEMGVNRYWKKVNRTTQKEMETNHPVGRRLLTESVNELAEAIKDWKHTTADRRAGPQHAAYPYIDMLDPPLIAALTARTIIDAISMHSKITKTAISIARMVEDEIRWRDIRREDPLLFAHHIEQTKKKRGYDSKRRHMNNLERLVDLNFSKWSNAVRVKVGMVLIELMKQSTGLIEIETRTGLLGKKDTFVRPTNYLLEWMKTAHKEGEDLYPVYLPMVAPPTEWTNIWNGGYRTVHIHRRPIIKSDDRAYLSEVAASDISEPMSAINVLQNVPWRINTKVYECMKYCWERGIPAGGLPAPDGEDIPSKPIDIDTNEEARRRWRKLAARIHYENESEESRRIQVAQVLWMSGKFKDNPIYMPWYMDFRGRMYPRPYGLQPQGPDWSRSLLKFATGSLMSPEGDRWLAIHGANCFGEDKVSYDDRVRWVHDNNDWIKSIGKDPEGSVSEWSKADEPWAFLAFCIEWREFMEKGHHHITTLPCSVDGSSNGLQILSLVMRDSVGALATNVLPNDLGIPADIYQQVADAAMQRLSVSDHPLAARWLAFGVDRSCTKRPTMVVPYSGTLFAVQDYTASWFRDELKKRKCENPFGWEEIYEPTRFLASIIWEALGDIVGEARKAMSWLQQCSDICVENGLPIRWTTPSGFPVKQAYETWQNQTIKTIIGDVVRRHKIHVGTGNLSKVKNRNGVAPNWVHSLDATVGQKSLLDCSRKGMSEINSIHDAFWTIAPHMPTLRESLIENVVQVFSADLLSDFKAGLEPYLPDGVTLPDPPAVGGLEISRVRHSEYLFS